MHLKYGISYLGMIVKTVRTSPKGQLTLPIAMLRALGIKGATELVAVQEGDRIVLARAEKVAQPLVDDLKGFSSLSIPALRAVWDNEADEVWNDL